MLILWYNASIYKLLFFFLPFIYHSNASIAVYIRYCRYNHNRKTINLTNNKINK